MNDMPDSYEKRVRQIVLEVLNECLTESDGSFVSYLDDFARRVSELMEKDNGD